MCAIVQAEHYDYHIPKSISDNNSPCFPNPPLNKPHSNNIPPELTKIL